jgi:hypothetical protein
MAEGHEVPGRCGERSAGVGGPAMPVIGSGEKPGGVPYPLLDGLRLMIGWRYRPSGKGDPEFVIIRRSFLGSRKVVKSFPPDDSGWAAAWQSFISLNPDAEASVRATLQDRQAAQVATRDPATPVAAVGDDEADLRGYLKDNLKRDVSTPGEGPGKKFVRVATNPYLVLGAATVGLGIATVLTAGTVHVVLGGVAAGQLASNGSSTIDWWKSNRQGTVYLDQSAVDYLLSNQSQDERRLAIVELALSTMPLGSVHLTGQDLRTAAGKLPGNRPATRLLAMLGSSYMRAGLALLSAGLFLIAIVLIPEYIRDATLRAAAVISFIGVILISISVVDRLKNL